MRRTAICTQTFQFALPEDADARPRRQPFDPPRYSHSIVPGGFEV